MAIATNSIPASVTVPCAHCGLPSPPTQSKELAFCCEGCRGAYHLIRQWGLDEYYELRDQLGGMSESVTKCSVDAEALSDPRLLGASAPVLCSGSTYRSRLAVEGLHCGACAWLIERAATQKPGWESARVRLSDHTVEVTYDAAWVNLPDLAKFIARLGYRVSPLTRTDSGQREIQEDRRHLIGIAMAFFCAANAMWIAVGLYAGQFSGISVEHHKFLHFSGVVLSTLSVAFPGRIFFRGAIAALRTRTPHMDLPISLGLGVGTLGGWVAVITNHGEAYFDSVAMLVFLLLLGRWIQYRQQRRASHAVARLLRLTPRMASRIDADGTVRRVAVETLAPSDRIRVASGEVFPVDGTIDHGATLVDRSLVSGESLPVSCSLGDSIEAGCCNLQASVDLTVHSVGRDTRLGKLESLIEDATSKRTRLIQLADSIGSRFVMIVMVLALLTFLVWFPREGWLAVEHSVALLIVACPCALALATPLAMAVALGRCASLGILVRDPEAIERVMRRGTIWFDKTGTLTLGRVALVDWDGDDSSLATAAAIESHAGHSIAQSILNEAKRRELLIPEADEVVQIPGCGVQGRVHGKQIRLGTQALLQRYGIEPSQPWQHRIASILATGHSPMLMAVDDQLVAIGSLGDNVRHDAPEVVRHVKNAGWTVGLLSGDHPKIAHEVANSVGIESKRVWGALTPEQKLQYVQQSRSTIGSVVMVGDGANDAAALAAADVGVAIRGGAVNSLNVAPVYLSRGELSQLLDFFSISQQTVRTLHWNFVVSLSYNFVAVGLAATGWITPLIAAILMPISSLTVLTMVIAMVRGPKTARE